MIGPPQYNRRIVRLAVSMKLNFLSILFFERSKNVNIILSSYSTIHKLHLIIFEAIVDSFRLGPQNGTFVNENFVVVTMVVVVCQFVGIFIWILA